MHMTRPLAISLALALAVTAAGSGHPETPQGSLANAAPSAVAAAFRARWAALEYELPLHASTFPGFSMYLQSARGHLVTAFRVDLTAEDIRIAFVGHWTDETRDADLIHGLAARSAGPLARELALLALAIRQSLGLTTANDEVLTCVYFKHHGVLGKDLFDFLGGMSYDSSADSLVDIDGATASAMTSRLPWVERPPEEYFAARLVARIDHDALVALAGPSRHGFQEVETLWRRLDGPGPQGLAYAEGHGYVTEEQRRAIRSMLAQRVREALQARLAEVAIANGDQGSLGSPEALWAECAEGVEVWATLAGAEGQLEVDAQPLIDLTERQADGILLTHGHRGPGAFDGFNSLWARLSDPGAQGIDSLVRRGFFTAEQGRTIRASMVDLMERRLRSDKLMLGNVPLDAKEHDEMREDAAEAERMLESMRRASGPRTER